jgi:glycosyltransferase involved in cell wall biosynthesis
VVPNINLDSFQHLPSMICLATISRNRKPYSNVYLGRLAVNKGIDIAIEAFARLLQEHDDILAGPR